MNFAADRKLKLMVVDDEPDNLDLIYRTFRRDFDVITAESAIAAWEILEQQGEMAIIISDQRMPEMMGTELLGKIAVHYPDTIRIVLTGYTDVEDLVDAINSGKVFKYITKPWTTIQLKGIIQQAAETYQVIKQRTNDLRRALRRESLFNAVTSAIRESLDYRSMLGTIAATIGCTFEAGQAILYLIEDDRLLPETFTYHNQDPAFTEAPNGTSDPLVLAALQTRQIRLANPASHQPTAQLAVPLTYQQEFLAILVLWHSCEQATWSAEDIDLIQSVAEPAALAMSQAKLYQRTQEQAEQMRAELAVAHQIQTNLLRQSWPQMEGMRIQACCYPAREVGGDFFEVYVHPQGDIWLAVGDVSGKGVPAALFMASAISVLRRELAQEAPPEPNIVLQNLNHSLLGDLVSTNCFITMVLARYSPATRQLVYANAGHIYPLVWASLDLAAHGAELADAAVDRAEGSGAIVEPQYLTVRGVPLGILPEWKAASGQCALQAGEIFLLTSDGITEASFTETLPAITTQNAAALPVSPPIADNTSTPPAPARPSSAAMLQQAGLWQLLLQEQKPLDLHRLVARIRAQNAIQEDDQTILALEVL
jgi:serine phosphatase RsbU (regulator of sigma subunit)/CheY-like chemotaxis protein